MSILIKGIDMPTSCENCFAFHSDESGNKGCFITMHIDTRDECQSIQTLCPLIEIPTPHGRLIDADELLSHLKKDPLFDLVERYGVSGVIKSRPTILDEERE